MRAKTFTTTWVVISCAFSVALAQGTQETSAITLSTPQQIEEDFREVPCKNKDRLAAVRSLFEKMGATSPEFSTQKTRIAENLVITKRGANEGGTIVIGAHYDLVEQGCGAIDNWSGIVAMAQVYRTIRSMPSNKTVLFVAFGNEETGRWGSRVMADAIPRANLPQYCAVINIDSFGMGNPFVLSQISSRKLTKVAEQQAAAMKVPFYDVEIPNASSDSESFLDRRIPAITLSGLANGWERTLHNSGDQVKAVNMTSVYLGYRLALAVWDAVDQASCNAFRE